MKKAIKNYLAKLQENEKKGFSLVELIIVMAIMAILVGIVASQVLPYMEKSRQSKDQQQLSSLGTDIVSSIAQASSTVSDFGPDVLSDEKFGSQPWAKTLKELRSSDGEGTGVTLDSINTTIKGKLVSKKGKDKDVYVGYDDDTGIVTVYVDGAAKGDKLYVETEPTAESGSGD